MKKLVVSLAMFVSVLSVALASDGGKTNYRVKESFDKEFAAAKSVTWELIKNENIYQARFTYNNERLNAFFDADGNLIATGRFISVANLPLLVRKNVFEKYGSYRITDVIEYVQGNQTSYLVSLENEKAKLLVHGYISGATYIFKKEKKNSLAKL